jgi:hypothetical protein
LLPTSTQGRPVDVAYVVVSESLAGVASCARAPAHGSRRAATEPCCVGSWTTGWGRAPGPACGEDRAAR